MQSQKANGVQIATLFVAIIIGAFFVYMMLNMPKQEDVPTAEEIAQLFPEPSTVVFPTAEEIAANINVPRLNNDNLDDVLEGVYPDLVDDMVDECTSDLWDEFGDNVDDDVEEKIEEDLEEEIKDVTIVDFDWDDNFDWTIINLGLDNDEDRKMEVTSTLRVKYHEEFGDSDWHFAQVDTVSLCDDYDNEDNEFDDLEVEYTVV
eukprot:GHVU01236362.1.p2 GENE.GHVU01236362.1~~GHVU01236362.1.p2  ORF type:complete len:204 (+),score=33.23 GHVU01236362.1:1034-1645(+)